MEISSSNIKKFLYFFKKKLFLYSPKRKLLCLEMKLSTSNIEKNRIFPQIAFFYISKNRTLHFSAQALKLK